MSKDTTKISDTAMVLAAGRGERMGSLTRDVPKPLLTVAGKAIIDYAIDRLQRAGIRRVVVNLHYQADALRRHLSARGAPEIVISDETSGLLNTGGGIAKALPLLGEAPFFVVNGDVIWFDGMVDSLQAMARRFEPGAMDGLLLLQPTVGAIGYRGVGDFVMDAAGRIDLRPEREVAPFVYTGVQLLAPALFQECPSGAFPVNLCYRRAIDAGRLFGLRHEGDWMELNRPEGLAAAAAALAP